MSCPERRREGGDGAFPSVPIVGRPALPMTRVPTVQVGSYEISSGGRHPDAGKSPALRAFMPRQPVMALPYRMSAPCGTGVAVDVETARLRP